MLEVTSNIYQIGESISSTDYIGFTFNNIHSSELGIVRISDGSRFSENLLPTIQDKTVQIPGGDGAYFFGSYYTQKPFNVSFAFDNMTEQQLAKLKKMLGDKKIHDLIFDEAPYKVYKAKITGSATIKHIPFSEGETNRVYKGEGSIQFTAYNPFARSVHKFLNEYNTLNTNEWKDASGMKAKPYVDENNESSLPIDKFVSRDRCFYLYNPGDKESDFVLKLNFVNSKIPSGSIYMNIGSQELRLKEITMKNGDAGIQINSKLNLIEGINSQGKKTGSVYNEYISSGDFFKIPQIGPSDASVQLFVDLSNGVAENHTPQIEYDYYYL